MKVRCVAERIAPGPGIDPTISDPRRSYGVEIGAEYLVYGISVQPTCVWLEVVVEFGQLISVPLSLFAISEPSVPAIWEARQGPDQVFRLWPREFYEEEFFVALVDSQEEAVATLQRLTAALG